MIRRIVPFLVAAALAAPQAAHAAVSIEAFYGLTRPRADSFRQAVSGTANDPNLYASSLNIAGGDLILHMGLFELGAILDTSWKSGSASQTAIGALGEVGGQRYGNFAENPSIATSGSDQWLMYLGLRPGVAIHVPTSQDGKIGVLVGVWGFARWDLNTATTAVSVVDAGSAASGSITLGGTTIGAELRLGVEF